MLQAIRSKTGSLAVKALAGLLIVAFAAWGVEDFISARATDVHVATVGDAEIDPVEMDILLGNEVRNMQRSLGGQLTEEQLIALGIGNSVLQRMINDAALTQIGRQLGLRASDAVVSQSIRSDPNFMGFDGTFSRAQFDSIMLHSGMNEAAYIESTRSDLSSNQVLFAASEATAPSRMQDLLAKYRFETRTAQTVQIAASAQPDPGQPTDTQLEETHQRLAEQFTAPEYRKISVVHLDPELLLDEVEVTEQQLVEAYEANKGQYVQPETRTVQQMVLIDEETANRASAALAEGQDFMTVATEIAEMEEAAVNLGTITRDGILPLLADVAFSLPGPGHSAQVKTPLGFHIMNVTEINPGETRTLDEVRDEVREIAARKNAIDALFDLSIRFEDAIGGGATLVEAGNEVGMPAMIIDAVDREGLAPSGAEAAGLPDIASLLPIAFSSELNIESPLTEVGEKGYFMVRVLDIIEPALRPLDTVRDEVADAWRQLQREEAARTIAQEISGAVSPSSPLTALAEERGLTVDDVGPVTRNERDAVSQSIVGVMFEIDENQSGIAKVDDGYVALHVTNVDTPAGPVASDDAANSADVNVVDDVTAQFIDALRSELGVTVNQRVYEAVLEPGHFDPNFFLQDLPR